MTNSRSAQHLGDPAAPASAFAYVHCDVPEGMTLGEWRRARNRARADRRKTPAAALRRLMPWR